MEKLGIFHGNYDSHVIFYKGDSFSRPNRFKWAVSQGLVWPNKVAPKELIRWLD